MEDVRIYPGGLQESPVPQMPDSIRVGHADYQVVKWDATEAVGADCRGQCSYEARQIRISERLASREAANTLLHEILHAIWDGYEIQAGDEEERNVSTMANAFCQVWRDNPDLVRFLDAALSEQPG